MSTYSVSLSDSDASAIEALTLQNPGANSHVIHLAALRLGLRQAQRSAEALRLELLDIGHERRERRQQKKEAE